MKNPLLRDTAAMFAASLALIAALALLMLAACPARARELMPLGFARATPTISAAASIALSNARVALVPFALAQVAHQGRLTRRVTDLLLATLLLVNAAEIAAAVAGYGARTLVALAPHAPLEFAAYSIAGATYLDGRRTRPRARRFVARAGACLALLVLAAVIETYVQLRVRS